MEPGSDLMTQKRKRLVKTGALVHNQADARVKLPGADSTRGQDVRVMQPWATRLEDVHHRKLQTPAGIATRGVPVAQSCARTRSGGKKNRRDSGGGTRTLCAIADAHAVPAGLGPDGLDSAGPPLAFGAGPLFAGALAPPRPPAAGAPWGAAPDAPFPFAVAPAGPPPPPPLPFPPPFALRQPDAVLQHPLVVPAGAVSQGLARRASLA